MKGIIQFAPEPEQNRMLSASHLTFLLIFGLVLWLWRDNLAAREVAIEAVKRTCQQLGVQMLDQTVAIQRVRPNLSSRGLRLRRKYQFEFSIDGGERFPGRAELLGQRVISVQLDGPEGMVIS
ncbi:hypothetical protein J2T60_000982 [Natronospira proteinivora]|uniref:DUF3301 domain-containing protein n=1 Tax=Natronospira proteinivora TaxID=1807133 RepID=A0ABT1G7G2_9GAMM|nr:DUF3301 domain-containing protein [Natronospira proteinivora]MCP1727017.1 hypothetical protein [Natronospira proteinivora]